MAEKELKDFKIGSKVRLLKDHAGVKKGTVGTVGSYLTPQLLVKFPERGIIYCYPDIVEEIEEKE